MKNNQTQFNKMVALYLKHLENIDCSPHTIRHYKTTLRDLGDFLSRKHHHSLRIDKITTNHLLSFLSYKREQGTTGRTRKNYIVTFRSFWRFLNVQNLCQTNPTNQLENIHTEKKERIYLTEDEMQRFLNVIDLPLVYAACTTICYSGLRISELCNLKLTDVSFSRQEIHVICGKGKKDRIVPLNSELSNILTAYISHDRNPDSEYLFSSKQSGRVSQQYLNKMIHKYAKLANVDSHISAHCLRHSFATALVSKGAPITSIQKILGHNDLKTTNIYMHMDQSELSHSINLLSHSLQNMPKATPVLCNEPSDTKDLLSLIQKKFANLTDSSQLPEPVLAFLLWFLNDY
ncbi:MAG: tyrosine-type recombinase/integrase [Lachnospiraceae bacterium]|nr:tyrosine-type recombinase/integrase [Lachnospiraceae bacterium]